RSVSRRRAAPPKPHLGEWSRRGRISERPWRPKLTDSTAPMAPECQSFLDNVVAHRHLIAELPRWITRERPVRWRLRAWHAVRVGDYPEPAISPELAGV